MPSVDFQVVSNSGFTFNVMIDPGTFPPDVKEMLEQADALAVSLIDAGFNPGNVAHGYQPPAGVINGPTWCGFQCSETLDDRGCPSWIMSPEGIQAQRRERQGDVWYSAKVAGGKDGDDSYIKVFSFPKGDGVPPLRWPEPPVPPVQGAPVPSGETGGSRPERQAGGAQDAPGETAFDPSPDPADDEPARVPLAKPTPEPGSNYATSAQRQTMTSLGENLYGANWLNSEEQRWAERASTGNVSECRLLKVEEAERVIEAMRFTQMLINETPKVSNPDGQMVVDYTVVNDKIEGILRWASLQDSPVDDEGLYGAMADLPAARSRELMRKLREQIEAAAQAAKAAPSTK